MQIITQSFETRNGLVEGVHLKSAGINFLLVSGSKGFLACSALNIEDAEQFGAAAALVECFPEKPIGTIDRFPDRLITKVNSKAKELGITVGMEVRQAFELIA